MEAFVFRTVCIGEKNLFFNKKKALTRIQNINGELYFSLEIIYIN